MSEAARQKEPYPRYKSLTPICDLRINLTGLYSFRELQLNRALRGRNVVPRLLHEKLYRPWTGTHAVWMRCISGNEKSVYNFIDEEAHDLKGSGKVFCRIFTYANSNEGYLYQLTAPSFKGRVAVSLAQNFMALLQVQSLLFSDVSTMVGCCNEALNSLHTYSVMTNGASWYALQGAVKRITSASFPVLHEQEYVEPEYIDQLTASEKTHPIVLDYKAYSASMLRRRFGTFVSDDVYEKACKFLKEVEIKDLKAEMRDADFRAHVDYLDAAAFRWKLPETTKLSALLREGTARAQSVANTHVQHAMAHEGRDLFVSNKDSRFNEKAIRFFARNQGVCTLHGLSLAFFVLSSYVMQLEASRAFQDKEEVRLHTVNPSQRLDSKFDIIDKLAFELKKNFLQYIEKGRGTPISTKIVAHSTPDARHRWAEYLEELDNDKKEAVVQDAFSYLLRLPIGDLRAEYPTWIAELEKNFGEFESEDTTLLMHMNSDANEKNAEKFCNQFLDFATQGFSIQVRRLFAIYKTNRHAIPVVDLFMMAKYILKRAELFQFQL